MMVNSSAYEERTVNYISHIVYDIGIVCLIDVIVN